MTPHFPRPLVLLTVAACVSFDPAGPPVRDISGNYTATVVTRIVNQFEVRSDTFGATLALRGTQNRGHFSGTYSLATDEAGPVAGVLRTDDTLLVSDFGAPPKPIAGVQYIRTLYPWCDFTLLGIGPIPGAFIRDSLQIQGEGSLPCFYRFGSGLVGDVHTQIFLLIAAAR